MIDVNLTTQANGMILVEFVTPEADPFEINSVLVHTQEDAERLLYFQNKKYMIDHLISFLKMRRFAMGIAGFDEQVNEAGVLMMQLKLFSTSLFRVLTKYIYMNENRFMAFTPSENSKHYKHYKRVIEPIFNFCRPLAKQAAA